MEACGFLTMDHPAHGPDVASSHFILCGRLKENMAGQLFDSDEEMSSGT
jgi:hypothetical protein